MNGRFTIPRRPLVLLVGVLVLALGSASAAFAERKFCDPDDPDYADTGNRVKCKMENMNDAFDGVVGTVLGDDTGAFSDEQKTQLTNLKTRVGRETERTNPTDFKQLGKKHPRNVQCVIQERIGDVMAADDLNGNGFCDEDEGEICIGDEDGICQLDEQVLPKPYKSGCAEVLDDGIGNDDGICDPKGTSGKFKEACIEDLILVEDDETNVDRGKADDVEQSLDDATAVLDDANTSLMRFIEARRAAFQGAFLCDPVTTPPCEYLKCLVEEERSYAANEIEGVVGGAAAAKIITDACRDAAKWDVFVNASAICIVPALVEQGLHVAASVLESIDDAQTAERLDATGKCVQEMGGQIKEVKALVEQVILLLKQPQGQRPGFQGRRR
jgi:hypothetical protein